MVDLNEEDAFWQFVAGKNTYVQHNPNASPLSGEFRFARFRDEATIGDTSKMGSPRLELLDGPNGNFSDNGGAFHWDSMYRTVRIIAKYERNDFNAKLATQQLCKKALAEIVAYIIQQQEEGDTCGNNILRMFDANNIRYQVLDAAGADASFTGCQMTIVFKSPLPASLTPNYGSFQYP